MVQHHTSRSYQLRINKMVEEFHKIPEQGLTKGFSINHDDWDERSQGFAGNSKSKRRSKYGSKIPKSIRMSGTHKP